MTLSLTINETLKWLSSLPIFTNAGVILAVTPPYTLPISPSIISLAVCADVRHHVYLIVSGKYQVVRVNEGHVRYNYYSQG